MNEKVKIAHTDDRFVTIEVHNYEINFSFNIIFIYAPPMDKYKNNFWEKLTNYMKNSSLPSIVLGDFNDILCFADKLGGAYPNRNRFQRINNIIQECNLIDVISRGNEFTWRKRREGENNTFEKLDRALAHFEALNKFNNLHVWNHAFSSSDHCLISINLNYSKQNFKNEPFRFKTCGRRGRIAGTLLTKLGVFMFQVLTCSSWLRN